MIKRLFTFSGDHQGLCCRIESLHQTCGCLAVRKLDSIQLGLPVDSVGELPAPSGNPQRLQGQAGSLIFQVDAMLALLSCSIKTGFDADLALFMGSLAAAQSVETIGNSTPVNKVQLLKTFSHALK